MAPNRKSLSALMAQTLSVSDLETLQSSTLTSKASAFLPLTHPSNEPQQQQQQQQQQQAPAPAASNADSSASYWDWTPSSDDVTESEQPTVCILSTENIVSNLIQAAAAARAKAAATSASRPETLAENDAYWAEGEQQMQDEDAPEMVVPSSPQHLMESASYWEWTTGTAKEVNPATSSANYWAWESKPVPAEYQENEQDQAENYWSWDTSSQRVAQLVMATTVLSQLQKEQQRASDSYWAWNKEEEQDDHQDQYWDMPSDPITPTIAATSVSAITTANMGYWD